MRTRPKKHRSSRSALLLVHILVSKEKEDRYRLEPWATVGSELIDSVARLAYLTAGLPLCETTMCRADWRILRAVSHSSTRWAGSNGVSLQDLTHSGLPWDAI